MHVLQYIAVQADTADEAMQSVEHRLNSELGSDEFASASWFDWFVIGGGRFVDGDPYESSPNHILAYKDKPEEFVAMIDRMISNRKLEFKGYRERYEAKQVDLSAKLDSYDGLTDYSFDLYDLHMMIELLQGHWNYNSYFYDMHNATTTTKYTLDNLSEMWYLVPVDFHF